MSVQQKEFTIGVEEEYQIIDPVSRELSSSALKLLKRAQQTIGEQVQPELRLSQIEIATPICHTLADVRLQLRHLRREVIHAAQQEGKAIASAGTHPFTHWRNQPVTPKPRYQELARDYQQLTREQAIYGCHVHVGVQNRELALQVMNRARPWLAILLALSASSPFWLGEETGYASYRTEIWSRWPMSGPPLPFSSLQEYNELAQHLIATGAIEDTTKIYWDMRLSERFETVEIRIADACLTIDEAVLLAGLIRALVRTCYEQALNNVPFIIVRPEVLRLAIWRAARYGLDDQLIDSEEHRLIPAAQLIEKFLTHLRPALEAEGDWPEISALLQKVQQAGNGAARLRAIYQRTGRKEDIVDYTLSETARETEEEIS